MTRASWVPTGWCYGLGRRDKGAKQTEYAPGEYRYVEREVFMAGETKTDHQIHPITLSMPLGMGKVNCYLIETPAGHTLIDTGNSTARKELLEALERLHCGAGSLKLILLTHGDFDHTGNALHLRSAFGAALGMHREDAAMAERGDMFVNRKKPNPVIGVLLPLFSRFGASERFTPDLLLGDGYDLSPHGMDARVIEIPGHSRGSIGILNAEGDLFCGDLFENTRRPRLNALMDDPAAAQNSVNKLKGLKVRKIYPGHGAPFLMEDLGA